jgi:hypothetical protein
LFGDEVRDGQTIVNSVEGFRKDRSEEVDGNWEGVSGAFEGGCSLTRLEEDG